VSVPRQGVPPALVLGQSVKGKISRLAKLQISLSTDHKLTRCHRLNKNCQPSPPARRRRILKGSDTSKLEEKLDGLVTFLKSAPGFVNASSFNKTSDISKASSHSPCDTTAAGSLGRGEHPTPNGSLPNQGCIQTSHSTPTTSYTSGSSSVNLEPSFLHLDLQPSPEDSESYLNRFRSEFTRHLPFIVISPSMTAHKLRQERPILWTAIMTVASSNCAQQAALSKEMRAIIGREAFVEGTRNMDLLLAVLVSAAW